METPLEVYKLFVKVVKACTGLDDAGAKAALARHDVHEPEEPEEKLELAEKTPVAGG